MKDENFENLSVVIIEKLILKGLVDGCLTLPVLMEYIRDCGNLEENLECINNLVDLF